MIFGGLEGRLLPVNPPIKYLWLVAGSVEWFSDTQAQGKQR